MTNFELELAFETFFPDGIIRLAFSQVESRCQQKSIFFTFLLFRYLFTFRHESFFKAPIIYSFFVVVNIGKNY